MSLHHLVSDPFCPSFCTLLLRFLSGSPHLFIRFLLLCPLFTVPYSPLWVLSLIFPLPVSRQVVEIALKVSPILGAHMFQPLLPAVFRGIVDGEVSFTLTSCKDLDWDYIKEPVKMIYYLWSIISTIFCWMFKDLPLLNFKLNYSWECSCMFLFVIVLSCHEVM